MDFTEDFLIKFWSKIKVENKDECWNWTGYKSKDGYGQIRINKIQYYSHRIIWIIHNGDIPFHDSYHGYCVCHTCDNRICCNPKHLFLGTNKDNMHDMIKKGRDKKAWGEQKPQHKITEEQVLEIRQKYSTGFYTQKQLSEEYNIDDSNISRIVNYKRWRNLL